MGGWYLTQRHAVMLHIPATRIPSPILQHPSQRPMIKPVIEFLENRKRQDTRMIQPLSVEAVEYHREPRHQHAPHTRPNQGSAVNPFPSHHGRETRPSPRVTQNPKPRTSPGLYDGANKAAESASGRGKSSPPGHHPPGSGPQVRPPPARPSDVPQVRLTEAAIPGSRKLGK